MVIELSRLFAICLAWFVVGFCARMAIEIISRHFRSRRKPNVIEQCSEHFARLRDLQQNQQQQPHTVREFCCRCSITQDCKLVSDANGVGTYCCECNHLVDYDYDDIDDEDFEDEDYEYDDDDDAWEDDESDEPVGSCEGCGTNLYEWDDDEVCDQCLWRLTGGAGRED